MAKISIAGNPSGTATYTIAAPAGSTDRTLTLPDNAGTVLTSASDLAAANLTGNVAAARITDALNASGSAPIYACRAWVNFNGVGGASIRASGNVSSVTRNGTGDYTVNFTTAMPDVDFSVAGGAFNNQSGGTFAGINDGRRTTTTVRVTTKGVNETLFDCPIVNVSIFR